MEAKYAQNHKSVLGKGLAACQNCSADTPTEIVEAERPQLLPQTQVFCRECLPRHAHSLRRGMFLQARGHPKGWYWGVLWLNDRPCPPQHVKLGPQSSQYAEIVAILITLQIASTHNRELLICTDSNYARLGFTCHLQGWKQNGFKTANNKPVKHQHLFQACDNITSEHDMIVYWKKVKGHSKQPGPDKDLNDQTDALAKAGALHGELWSPYLCHL